MTVQEQFAEKNRKAKHQALSLLERIVLMEAIDNQELEKEARRLLKANGYQ